MKPMRAPIKDGVIYSPYPVCSIPCSSIYTAIQRCIEASPDRIAIVDDSVQLTRAQFFARIKRCAAGLQAHGIKPGDHVCVHLDTSVENLIAMFGFVFAGATLILSYIGLNEDELLSHIKDGDVTHILTDFKNAKKCINLQKQSSVNLMGLFINGELPGFIDVLELSTSDESNFVEVDVPDPANTLAAICYTSGTTALSKGVEITHLSFVASLYASKACMTDEGADVLLACYPLTFASGFQFIMSAACSGSTCVVVSPMMMFDRFAQVINEFQVTTISSSPTQLLYFTSEMRRTGVQLNSVRKINTGGTAPSEVLAKALMTVFRDLRCLRNNYSQSESCGLVFFPPSDEMDLRSMGFPAPMVQIKFVDIETGEPIGPEVPGELCYKSPCSMRGYYKCPEKTSEFRDKDGWCHSGDIAYYDQDGRVYFVDRLKEFIKCMNDKAYPSELENLLLKNHDEIAEVAVAGLPHDEHIEVAAAFVVLKESHKKDRKTTAAEMKKTVSDVCPIYKHLHGGVYFLDHLPRTPTAKVKRAALKAYAASLGSSASDSITSSK
ncbi:4-coumarate--CoA ligase 1-like [Ixodes scapularis]|uniref:4-coumarate--CoA ligase 1-like n=1 Tax=Ixodes scapularis TaxID=6945 RepID=UPI001C38516F|nr:4-coumarate--CoA ligase 1-like [Ixodes scapularis]